MENCYFRLLFTMMNLLLLITWLSPIPSLAFAVRRYRGLHSLTNRLLVGTCLLVTLLEWYGLFFNLPHFSLPVVIMNAVGHVDSTLVSHLFYCGMILLVNVTLLSFVLFAKRNKMMKFWLGLILFYLVLLVVTAIIGSAVTERSLDECFFGACCCLLYGVGFVVGLTYKEICVIVNIYLQAFVCLLSALWVTWVCIRNYRQSKTNGRMLLMLLGILYGIAYMAAFVWLCTHYAMPLDDAFNLCYRELMSLASMYQTTYNIVNYLIFIVFFLVCIIGNFMFVRLLKKLDAIKTK